MRLINIIYIIYLNNILIFLILKDKYLRDLNVLIYI